MYFVRVGWLKDHRVRFTWDVKHDETCREALSQAHIRRLQTTNSEMMLALMKGLKRVIRAPKCSLHVEEMERLTGKALDWWLDAVWANGADDGLQKPEEDFLGGAEDVVVRKAVGRIFAGCTNYRSWMKMVGRDKGR